MSGLNLKSSKSKKRHDTLDKIHEKMIDEMNMGEDILIPKLKNEYETLKKKYKKCNIEEKLTIQDRLKVIKNEIKELKSTKKNYLLENSKYVFEYFENKQDIDKNENDKKTLDKFFNIKNIAKEIKKEQNYSEKYLRNIDQTFLNMENFIEKNDICKSCNNGELITVQNEGIMVCNHCFKNYKILVDNDKPCYKEPPKEVCFYAYKRINHFREILAQFQAKETTEIPEEVIINLKNQIKKERIQLHQITNKKTKEFLKKLGYNKYYEHIPFIKDKLGIKPPIMTPELEEILCNLFMDIQVPYSKYCPQGRVNFLNYYYTVYKLCELLDQQQFLPYFPMLKDREKRIEQDEIWKNICQDLNWQFIPTL
jgi:hypothetical protein